MILPIQIVTKILPIDFQAGTKSTHDIKVDLAKGTVSHKFKTGVTKIIGLEIKSVRNDFKITGIKKKKDHLYFRALGQTASGTLVIVAINYDFEFCIKDDGTGFFSGKHDGYPAYVVSVAGKQKYYFKHKSGDLKKLAGDLDVSSGMIKF